MVSCTFYVIINHYFHVHICYNFVQNLVHLVVHHFLSPFEGVAQVMNRIDGHSFDDHDDQLFEVGSYKSVKNSHYVEAQRRSLVSERWDDCCYKE